MIKCLPWLSRIGQITCYPRPGFATYKTETILLGSWTAVKTQGVTDCSLENRRGCPRQWPCLSHLQERVRHLKRGGCCAFSNYYYRQVIYFRIRKTEFKWGMDRNTSDTPVTHKGVPESIASISCCPDNTTSCPRPVPAHPGEHCGLRCWSVNSEGGGQ